MMELDPRGHFLPKHFSGGLDVGLRAEAEERRDGRGRGPRRRRVREFASRTRRSVAPVRPAAIPAPGARTEQAGEPRERRRERAGPPRQQLVHPKVRGGRRRRIEGRRRDRVRVHGSDTAASRWRAVHGQPAVRVIAVRREGRQRRHRGRRAQGGRHRSVQEGHPRIAPAQGTGGRAPHQAPVRPHRVRGGAAKDPVLPRHRRRHGAAVGRPEGRREARARFQTATRRRPRGRHRARYRHVRAF